MPRNTIIAGLAAVVAATAIAAPAQAQVAPSQPSGPGAPTEIIPPAQPSTPTGGQGTIIPPAQPASPTTTIGFGDCHVARSSHGYAYAVCPVTADNVPAGGTVSISYRSNLKTFKPRTAGSWRAGSGTFSLSNDTVGDSPANVVGHIKLAFRGKSVAQVRKDFVLVATGSTGAGITQPIGSVRG